MKGEAGLRERKVNLQQRCLRGGLTKDKLERERRVEFMETAGVYRPSRGTLGLAENGLLLLCGLVDPGRETS